MAVVLHLDQHVVGGNKRLLVEGGAFGGRHVARAHGDLAAVLHRVARVDDQVDDDLFELVEVGLDQPQVAPVHDVEPDRLADQTAQQHLQLRQHFAELQRLRPQRLPAREGEQLPHQPGRPVGVLLDLHDVLEGRIGGAVIAEQQVGIADDRGQHIVEVVGDAAGELADRLHLLALDEALLQRALLGGVEGEDERARPFVVLRFGGGQKKRAERGGSPLSATSTGAMSPLPPLASAMASASASWSRSAPRRRSRALPVRPPASAPKGRGARRRRWRAGPRRRRRPKRSPSASN